MSDDELNCTCCTCGYTWLRGKRGDHQCSTYMAATIATLQAQLAQARELHATETEILKSHFKACNIELEELRTELQQAREQVVDLEFQRNKAHSQHAWLNLDAYRMYGLLMLALYHSQGGKSQVGQAIRQAFGIGQHDHMTQSQIDAGQMALHSEKYLKPIIVNFAGENHP